MSYSREPTRHTCPDIDSVISSIKDALRECVYSDGEEKEDLHMRLDEISNHLYGLERKLEDLRRTNSSLRDWGNEEAQRVDELEEEVEELKKEIDLR